MRWNPARSVRARLIVAFLVLGLVPLTLVSLVAYRSAAASLTDVFPQIDEARDEATRDFLIHGGSKGAISREQWRSNLDAGLDVVNGLLMKRTPGIGSVKTDWDARFLGLLASQNLGAFDAWRDDEVYRSAGNGAGEVREWIAALAAAKAAGAGNVVVDHYEAGTCIGVAAAVVHAAPQQSPA